MTTSKDYQEARAIVAARLESLNAYNAALERFDLPKVEREISVPVADLRLLLSGPAEPTEPVAWRTRGKNLTWEYHTLDTPGPSVVATEVQPLYTSPAPSGPPVTAEEIARVLFRAEFTGPEWSDHNWPRDVHPTDRARITRDAQAVLALLKGTKP